MAHQRTHATAAPTGAAAHLGIDLREYDAKIRTFIPGYDAMLEAAAEAFAATVSRRAPVVVDLGIGTGALSAACRARVPDLRVAGIDEDAAMLSLARARLGDSLTAVLGNFERAAIPKCHAVVASLALHHIPTRARRLRLFRRIRRSLVRGGVLIVADCFPQSNPRLASADRAGWIRHLEGSYSPSEARAYLRAWAREDYYQLLTDDFATLRRAGFTVDVPSRHGTFAVVLAS